MNNFVETIATAHSNIINITETIYRQDLRNYDIQRSVLSLIPGRITKLQQVVRLERTLDTFLLGATHSHSHLTNGSRHSGQESS